MASFGQPSGIALGNVLRKYVDIERAFRLCQVVGVSRWASTGPSFVTCAIDGTAVDVIYRDGPVPTIGSFLPVVRMNAGVTSPWLALPLPINVGYKVSAFIAPAFDNRHYLVGEGKMSAGGNAPTDPGFMAILGRRNDMTWEKRSDYPLPPADYPATFGVDATEATAKIFGPVIYDGVNTSIITWTHPDGDPLAGATAVNCFATQDDGATWSPVVGWPGFTDYLFNSVGLSLSCILYAGGQRVGATSDLHSSPVVTANLYPLPGGPYTGIAFAYTEPSLSPPFYLWFGLLKPGGMKIIRVENVGGTTGWAYTGLDFDYTLGSTPTNAEYAQTQVYYTSTGDPTQWVVDWLTGQDPESGATEVRRAVMADIVAGTATWPVVISGTDTLDVRPAIMATNLQHDKTHPTIGPDNPVPGFRGSGVTPGATPYIAYPASAAVYLPVGAAAYIPPHVRSVITHSQQWSDDSGTVASHPGGTAFHGPRPTMGARFTGDADDGAGGVVFGPRLVRVVLHPGSTIVTTPSDAVICEDGDLETFAGAARYALFGRAVLAVQPDTGSGYWWNIAV